MVGRATSCDRTLSRLFCLNVGDVAGATSLLLSGNIRLISRERRKPRCEERGNRSKHHDNEEDEISEVISHLGCHPPDSMRCSPYHRSHSFARDSARCRPPPSRLAETGAPLPATSPRHSGKERPTSASPRSAACGKNRPTHRKKLSAPL